MNILPIPGFPDYQVSNDGTLYKKGIPKKASCKKGRSAKVVIRKNRKMYTLGLGILVARLFVANPHNYKRIIFKDRNHHNCKDRNIAWVDEEIYFFYCCPTGRGRPKIVHTKEYAVGMQQTMTYWHFIKPVMTTG
jgi:hypothetical protein